MKNLIVSINNRKQPVVWNPYEKNDGLSREEFIALAMISGYKTIIYEDAWITAYQYQINTHGFETLNKHLKEAVKDELFVYAALLRNEINRLATSAINEVKESY